MSEWADVRARIISIPASHAGGDAATVDPVNLNNVFQSPPPMREATRSTAMPERQ